MTDRTISNSNITELIESIPAEPQRQDSTRDQLWDMKAVANRLGCYDAADAVTLLLEKQTISTAIKQDADRAS